jgi:hypothetical protein
MQIKTQVFTCGKQGSNSNDTFIAPEVMQDAIDRYMAGPDHLF